MRKKTTHEDYRTSGFTDRLKLHLTRVENLKRIERCRVKRTGDE